MSAALKGEPGYASTRGQRSPELLHTLNLYKGSVFKNLCTTWGFCSIFYRVGVFMARWTDKASSELQGRHRSFLLERF